MGEAEAALKDIENLPGPEAAELRAQALVALGRPALAANEWAAAGNTDAELRAQSWAGNWDDLAARDSSVWQAAAGLARAAAPKDTPGPLALGNALVADSAKARSALVTLLGAIVGPVLPD